MKQVEIFIEKLAFGGDGIGTVNGKTCFVEGALPGERVLAKLLQDKKNFNRLKLIKVLKPSPNRIDPACPYVDRCGGCQYQHLSYEEELCQKELQIREIFSRSLGLSPALVKSIVHSKHALRYRNNLTLHRSLEDSKLPQALSFIGRDNHSKVVIKDCLIADERYKPLFNQKVKLKKTTEKISFKISEDGKVYSDEEDIFLRIRLRGESLLVHSKGFFQNNLFVTELLVKNIENIIQDSRCEVFFDLFSGMGTFSFLSAKSVPRIYCIEENPYSVHALRMNKEERKWNHLQVVTGTVENVFPDLLRQEKNKNLLILLDPPRQGLHAKLSEYLSLEGASNRLVYLSCDPMTLARDLKIIMKHGCYEISSITPFDMFPRTKHIETLVSLKKVSQAILV